MLTSGSRPNGRWQRQETLILAPRLSYFTIRDNVRLPARSPNLTPHIEWFMRSIKEEYLLRMIFFGETSLRHAIQEYLVDYHGERNHQGLANRILMPGEEVGSVVGEVQCRERLGGLLRYYHRKAA